MLPTDPLAVSLDEGSSSSADEIGNPAGSREHLLHNVTHTYIKTAWQSLLRSLMRSVRRRAATSKRANRKLFRSRSPVGESEAHSSLRTPFLSGSGPTALLFPVRATSSQYTIAECSPHDRKAPEVISPH